MKNKIKGLVLILIIFGVVLLMPGFMENTTKAADESDWSYEGSEDFNGYTILEIMPYKGMGEMGYLVGGQEPIDEELMDYNENKGQFVHMGDAVTLYHSYKESTLPASGTPDTDWTLATTYAPQNGYFERVSTSGPKLYTITNNQTVYQYVTDHSGSFRASLPNGAVMDNVYEDRPYNPVNLKNVIAYFTYDDTEDVFSRTIIYKPYCVTAVANHTGDYNYDAERQRFMLTKGKGAYDVIFVPGTSAVPYYMCNDYKIVGDNSGEYSYSGMINYSAQPNGDYKQFTNAPTFSYEPYWGGYYRWVQDDTALTKTNYAVEGNRIWVQGVKIFQQYQYTYKIGLVNNELFKRKSLGIPSELANDYPVRVVTITPRDLNKPENQHLIDEANLIYIKGDNTQYAPYISLYENFSYEGLKLAPANRYADNYDKRQAELNFAWNDINWTVTDKLFRKIAGIGCYKASVIVDATYYFDAIGGNVDAYKTYYKNNVNIGVSYNSGGATSVNMAKLYIMIYQRNKIDFYNSFMNPDTTVVQNRINPYTVATGVSPSGTTGSFIRPGSTYQPTSNFAIYWNGNTFLPYGLNASGTMTSIPEANFDSSGIYHDRIVRVDYDVTDNVITINGSFSGEVYLGSSFGDISDDTNIITNDGDGYGDTGGVSYPGGGDVEGPVPEVPEDPAQIPEDGTDESNLRTYKRVLNIQPTAYFAASETDIRTILSKYSVQIVNMTSVQFNSSIEDINSRYDMIYMGSGMLGTTSYNRFNMAANKTDFNDNTMDSYFYTKTGDQMKLATNSSTVRYRSNDITAQKRSELKEFLDAGYPIVTDSYLYQLTNTTARVNNQTVMYSFINGSKSYLNLLNMANYITDTYGSRNIFNDRLKTGLNIKRPIIDIIDPVLPEGTAVYDSATELLTIRFKLLPKNGVPDYHTYNAYLYIDKNGDGIFDEATEKTIPTDTSSYANIRTGTNLLYKSEYHMSALNGVYQWKIKVERTDNTLIRGIATGYVAYTAIKELNILQIRDNDAAYSLEAAIADTQKLINTYARDGKLEDYHLNFETLTVAQYEAKFVGTTNKYDPLNAAATSKLSKYHLLILDNPNVPINNTNGAVTNIKDEINKNLGVIFTKNALGYDRQRNYFSTDKYSFIDHDSTLANYTYTYNYLNRNATSGYLYNFRGMKGDYSTNLKSDDAYRTNYVTKANDGKISKYPYQIDRAISIANNSYSNDAVIDYDLTLTPKQRLIGWYCLSDTRSPVVREVFGLGTSSELYFGTYSSSPNDVKNNYYLFSNGPCYYSGIQLSTADQLGNDNEMKLFVNTLIAAHQATSNRVVSAPPVIEILRPTPTPIAGKQTIQITSSDLTEGNLILFFKLSESTSNMDLNIKLNDSADTSSTWDDIVYKSDVSFTVGASVSINNTSKVIENGIYALKIPATKLVGECKLTLKATNSSANDDIEEVYLRFVQPPTITILDPAPPAGATTQYIYADLDYISDAPSEDYLASEPPIKIQFKVEAPLNYNLTYQSPGAIGPESLTDGGLDDVTETILVDDDPAISGISRTYELLVPAYFIKDVNTRDLIITAADQINPALKAEVTLRILRRSLFPLD